MSKSNIDKQIHKVYDLIPKDKQIPFDAFKNRVDLTKKAATGKMTTFQAAKKVANTNSFTSAAERSRVNLLESIKREFKDKYKQLQRLSRDAKGRFVSIKDHLVWDKDRKGYVLETVKGKRYFIDTTNSPKDVFITEIYD